VIAAMIGALSFLTMGAGWKAWFATGVNPRDDAKRPAHAQNPA
jgi:hypothetical protein